MFWLIFASVSASTSILMYTEDQMTFNGKLNKSYEQREKDEQQEEIKRINDSKFNYNSIEQVSYDEI